MKEIRIISQNDKALPILYKEWWSLVAIAEGKFYLDREIKISRTQKKTERTEEYQNFHDTYPKKSWITSDSVIRKINEAVKDWTYTRVMEWVERYNKKIAIEKIVPKFILNAETFLNQRRWEDQFDCFSERIPIAEKWILDKIRDLNELETKECMRMKKEWEAKQKRDCSPWVFDNIVKRVKWEEI